MKLLPLSRGVYAQVSDEDYERAAQFKWSLTYCPNGKTGNSPKFYAHRKQRVDGRRMTIYLHRFLLDAPAGLVVDHLDGDGLNCQRENMVVTTQLQNSQTHRRKPRIEEPAL